MRFSRFLLIFLIILLTYTLGLSATTGKLQLTKEYLLPEGPESQRRIHPAESYFRKGLIDREPSRVDNFNRLLVLLVDFQEDDDPRTTGNGKFVLEPYPDYPVTLGAPPRDYAYFEAHLEAMKYYYLAASLGNYELEYDIYPREEDDFFAYTLPQQMGYYNPGLENYSLFIERIEEYFFDVFTTADREGDIQFGDYGHYMIIHAGSDWQHDVYGDTPSDLPSFFIQVGEGKEVWVNDGTVKISHASNVPETISQDDRYGVINAVMAHEFGHSLGFVDLYNVNNFYPAVGYWDIMDSGGIGRLVTMGTDGNLYAIEGGLPTLPSAWHRLLVWQDEYTAMGAFREVSELPQGTGISLTAASSLPKQDNPLPYIVKVPLKTGEYILLENRHVDPDGDGGVGFVGSAPITPGGTDFRVLLHPTGTDIDDREPNYEYDWLLPGWMNRQGDSFGGGMIAWHIDEKVIYGEGVYDSEGIFRSNYENNSVNTDYNRRGIRIIEADNLPDIGNPYSWYWYGTEYESFFRYRPELDSDGFFVRWSYEEFSNTLSSASKPPLLTNSGYPSMYRIYDISSSAGIMSFKYNFEPFESTRVLSEQVKINYLAPPAGSSFLTARSELPVFTEEGLVFFRHLYEPDENLDEWDDFFGAFPFAYLPTQPVIVHEQTGSPTEYYVTSGEDIIRISEDLGDFRQKIMEFSDEVVESPLLIEIFDDLLLIVPTEQELIIRSELDDEIVTTLPLAKARIGYDGDNLYAVNEEFLYVIPANYLSGTGEPRSGGIPGTQLDLPFEPDFDYYPVFYKDEKNPGHNAFFIQSEEGNIYKYRSNSFSRFFTLEQYTEVKPTQLALGAIDEQVHLFFAAGEYIFAVDIYGNMVSGYPRFTENKQFRAKGEIRLLNIDQRVSLVLPVEDEGYLLYEHEGSFIPEFSLIWDKPDVTELLTIDFPDHFFWEEISQRLYFFFSDSGDYLYDNIFITSADNPIIWNGYRNDNFSLYRGVHKIDTTVHDIVKAYAFPNPAKYGEVRIRVEGARDKIELQIFDISGKKLYTEVYDEHISSRHDILWNTANIATGVYFGIVKTNGMTTNFKLAIEQ